MKGSGVFDGVSCLQALAPNLPDWSCPAVYATEATKENLGLYKRGDGSEGACCLEASGSCKHGH